MPRRVPGSRSNSSAVFGRGRPATCVRIAAMSRSIRAASRSASSRAADPLTKPPDRHGDVRQSGVLVVEPRHARPIEPRDQLLLCAVDDDEIRLERENALDVRIEQRADSLPRRDLRRIPVEARHADDLIARADGEEHLGDGGDERDDPVGGTPASLRPSRSRWKRVSRKARCASNHAAA